MNHTVHETRKRKKSHQGREQERINKPGVCEWAFIGPEFENGLAFPLSPLLFGYEHHTSPYNLSVMELCTVYQYVTVWEAQGGYGVPGTHADIHPIHSRHL